jgi:hypothetical protein
MSIYDELQPIARDLLGEFKQGTIALVSITLGGGPADNPGAPTIVSTALSATARGASRQYVRDGFALATDLEVTAAVVEGITPTLNDFIDIDGERYKIIRDISKPAAGTRVVWKFLVRK